MDTLDKTLPDSVYKRYIASLTRLISESMNKQVLWWVRAGDSPQNAMLYDSRSGLLWDAAPDAGSVSSTDDARLKAYELQIAGVDQWHLPTRAQLATFAKHSANPLRKGSNDRLLDKDYWVTSSGTLDLDASGGEPSLQRHGALLACNELLVGKNHSDVAGIALQRGWQLLDAIQEKTLPLSMLEEEPDLQGAYFDIDFVSARLPELEGTQFTDPHKGLWEFWGMDPALLERQGVRARNPALDVRDCNVAIDFGTSSTVVAYDDNDQHKLLRIGMGSYWDQERPEHYENPTLLEFINFPGLFEAWHSEAFRPGVSWDHVHCSHTALQSLRDNKSDPRVVASTLAKIKHWALREGNSPRLRLSDRNEPKGLEHELAALTLRNPVRGQAMSVSPQDPFDPIELYAWFLGLNINWRGRGLFLRYYMTFPVGYPREVKDKILASFRRGLLRSLPASLVGEPVFASFSVEERASEPAAYAAGVMPRLGIAPSREGVAYGVFDFGGGTTDFDFGRYRLPTDEEEDEGKEEIFEHFGAAGDRFLGGENLLEHLAYRVFRENLEVCRKHRIAFSRPLDAEDFAGSEMFLEQTQAASTNMVMLMARLRPLWENGALDSTSGMETLDLLDREGNKASCQLKVPVEALDAYLEQRIEQGVCNFLAALDKAFAGQQPEQVQVLLAGNASRSRWVLDAFKALAEDADPATCTRESQVRVRRYAEQLFQQRNLALRVHAPLPACEQNPFTPTAKTGVALGLLRLCPGSVVKVVNRAQAQSGDEAPFAHYVGRVRQGQFQAVIVPGAEYEQWHELGAPSEGVFNLYHSQSPHAHTGEMKQGEAGLFKQRLELPGARQGHRVFARIVGPSRIEYCSAASREDACGATHANLSTLDLGK